MTIADLVIRLGLDDQASKRLDTVGGKIQHGFQRALLPAAAAMGGLAIGAKKAIDAASDVNEAQSAVGATFKKSAGTILTWSKSTDDAFSQVQFLDAAKQFGTFGKSAGLAGGDLTDFSKNLIDAAGDLSSFHNVPIDQALEDIRSGLAGETEPLRKYGILLNDATLRQEAMRQGLIKNTKTALTPQQKTLASQALILKKLGPAAGDWERTSNSAANTARRQAANTADLTASMGKGLLPIYQSLQGVLIKVTQFMADHTGAAKIAIGVLAGLAATVLVVNGAMKVWGALQPLITAAQWAWNAALAANPLVLIVAGLVLLVAALVVAYKKSETFRRIVNAAFDAVKGAALAFVDFFTTTLPNAFKRVLAWVRANWPKIAVFLAGPFAPLVLLATDAFGIRSKLVGALTGLISKAKDVARRIGSGIKDGIVGALSGLGSALGGAVRAGINAVITALRSFGIPGFSIDKGPIHFSFGGLHPFAGIPYLAEGGIATGPTLAMIGEGASPEAVIPLDRARLEGLGLGGRVEQHFHFPRYSGSRRELIADVKAGLDEERRRTGRDAF